MKDNTKIFSIFLIAITTILVFAFACADSIEDFYGDLNITTTSTIEDSSTQPTNSNISTIKTSSSSVSTAITSTSSTTKVNKPSDNILTKVTLLGVPEGTTSSNNIYITVSGSDFTNYKYKVNSGAYGDKFPIDQDIKLENLENGDYTIYVIGLTEDGQWQQIPTEATWIVDSSYPMAMLSDLPAKINAPPTATITVSGLNVENYCYQIDGLGYSAAVPVSTQISLSGLSDGSHTIEVKGQNALNVWQVNPTSYTWTVDTNTPMPGDPAGTIVINSDSLYCTVKGVTLALTATTGSGFTIDSMRFSNDSVNWSTWVAFAASYSWDLDDSTEGLKTVYAQFTDNGGQISKVIISDSITYDATAPVNVDFTISPATSTSLSVDLTITADETASGIDQMRLKTGNGNWGNWIDYSANFTYSVDDNPYGPITVHLQLKDKAGHLSSSVDKTFIYSSGAANDSIFVDNTNGLDTNDGLTSSAPVKHISIGITKAQAHVPPIKQIKVSHDIYSDDALSIPKDISIFGGYNTNFTVRDSLTYQTEITQNTSASTISFTSNVDNSSVIDGFIIKAPTSLGGESYTILCDAGASPTIRNCSIENNNTGTVAYGLKFDDSSTAKAVNLKVIIGSTATDKNGIMLDNNSNVNLTDIEISCNKAIDGGSNLTGILIDNNSEFNGTNIKTYLDSSSTGIVRGIHVTNGSILNINKAHVKIYNSAPTTKYGIVINSNAYANIEQGHSYIYDNNEVYAIYINNASTTNLTNIKRMHIEANSSNNYAKGIRINNSFVYIDKNYIQGGTNTNQNSAYNMGIEIIDSSNIRIKNNVIFGSKSSNVYCAARGLSISNSNVTITNNSIWAKYFTLNYPSAKYTTVTSYSIYLAGGTTDVKLINNIIKSHRYSSSSYSKIVVGYGVYENGSANVSLFLNNLFFTNYAWYHFRDSSGTNSTSASQLNDPTRTTNGLASSTSGNMTADPSSVIVSEYSDEHLKSGSHAIDAGYDSSPSGYGHVLKDKDNQNRTAPYDIGAYEY